MFQQDMFNFFAKNLIEKNLMKLVARFCNTFFRTLKIPKHIHLIRNKDSS